MNDLADIHADTLVREHADGAHPITNSTPDCPECEDAPAEDRPHTFILTTAGLHECGLPGCGRDLTSPYHVTED